MKRKVVASGLWGSQSRKRKVVAIGFVREKNGGGS
jgi:hypothetical protein